MQCRSCQSSDLTDILSLGDLYLSDFINQKEEYKADKYPLDLIICKACNLVQLKHTTPSNVLYTDHYGYLSGINNTMRKELKGITETAEALTMPKAGDMVIDIGANDKTLLNSYKTEGLEKVGFDPIAKFGGYYYESKDIFINDYFNYEKFSQVFGDKKAKIITAISMFYDLEDPNKFVADVKKCLDKDGIFIIQQNYLLNMIKNNAYDNIVHEHLEYYSLLALEPLLERHGLKVVSAIETPINGGSFRVHVTHAERVQNTSNTVRKMREKERKAHLDSLQTYKEFAFRIKKTSEKLLEFVKEETAKGKIIYVYGASTRGGTMLQYSGLRYPLIKKAVERNKEKWGKKIASVDIPIISEEQMREEKPDYLLVLPWFFYFEMRERENAYIQSGGAFIIPLPEVKVI